MVATGHFSVWAAKTTTLRAGVGEIEVLEANGVGAVADFIGRRGPGLFAVGLATAEPEKFRSHLDTQGVFFEAGEGRLFVTSGKGVGLSGLNLVVTRAKERAPVGLLQRLCGATLLHRFVDPGNLLRILAGRSSQLSPVGQETPGFTGSVIRLGDGLASHVAILAPRGNDTMIGRFFYQRGPGIYLASAMTDRLAVIREQLATLARAAAAPSADGALLIPPHLLGGARLAVYTGAAACSSWDVSSPIFADETAWA